MSANIEKQIADLFAQFRPSLPAGVVEEGLDLVNHNECGVALELLCQMLFEYSVPLQAVDFAVIKEATATLQLGPNTWDFLEPLVT
jgi:hypothetical protein